MFSSFPSDHILRMATSIATTAIKEAPTRKPCWNLARSTTAPRPHGASKTDETENLVESLFRFDNRSFGDFDRQLFFPPLTLTPLLSGFHLALIARYYRRVEE
jgi:hypothetical protein